MRLATFLLSLAFAATALAVAAPPASACLQPLCGGPLPGCGDNVPCCDPWTSCLLPCGVAGCCMGPVCTEPVALPCQDGLRGCVYVHPVPGCGDNVPCDPLPLP